MDFGSGSIVSRELLPNETVLWQGRPDIKKMFTKSDIFLVPYSLLWGGFTIFWFIKATSAGGRFGLVGIAFVIVGLYFIFGRFLVKEADKKKTYYAITNNRVLVVKIDRNGMKKSIASAYINSVPTESVDVDRNGFGTILFGTPPYWQSMYMNTGMDLFIWYAQTNLVAFFDIENCENVYKIYNGVKQQQLAKQ